ncbi:MAG: putative metal-binding motif-containing protein [Deltaproteobacteria bacterium]|nr:putative metal-binding motif-containing protein [Deltaproteobacteria bacterium]
MRPSLLVLLSLFPLLGCGSDVSIGKVTVDRDSDGYDETVDCDDAQSAVNPSAPELCDGLDNDCDGVVDEDAEDATTFYADADADGHGDPTAPTVACEAPADTVLNGDDCDDDQPAAFPGNDELCDGLDNDCDGDTDEDAEDVVEVFADGDGDGFGEDSTAAVACAPGPG